MEYDAKINKMVEDEFGWISDRCVYETLMGLMSAIDKGDTMAMKNLSDFYSSGMPALGIKQNRSKAVYWQRKADGGLINGKVYCYNLTGGKDLVIVKNSLLYGDGGSKGDFYIGWYDKNSVYYGNNGDKNSLKIGSFHRYKNDSNSEMICFLGLSKPDGSYKCELFQVRDTGVSDAFDKSLAFSIDCDIHSTFAAFACYQFLCENAPYYNFYRTD